MAESLYIIDLFSLMFQVYHAIPPMTGPAGQATNALFGITRDLITILRDQHPDFLIAAMDSPGPGRRNEIYPDYKAHRDEIPPDLSPQVPIIEEVIEAFSIPAVTVSGWEADDVIATITRQALERGFDVRIITSDKDARQLLGPHVMLYNVRKDTFFDESDLREQWGIRPDQVIDFQALVGDTSDNVPGVPLVGPKKASALLTQFETLDEVLENAEKAKGPKLRANLKQFADQARLSRTLVTLKTDLEIDVDWERARVGQFDLDLLEKLFREAGFRRFGEEVRKLAGPAVKQATSSPKGAGKAKTQATLFPPGEQTTVLVDTPAKLDEFVSRLREQKRFCLDLETTTLDAMRADIVGWAFTWEPQTGYYLPVAGPDGRTVLDAAAVRDRLKPILESPDVAVTNQNIKYDLLVLRRAGIDLRNVDLDPMVAHYLLDAGARSHGLEALAEKYLRHRMIPISDLIGSGKNQKRMDEVDVDRIAEYAVEDAEVCWRIAGIVRSELEEEALWDLYWDLERPLIPVLAEMEFTGITVDAAELKRQSSELSHRLDELIEEIYEEAGREFNIDSPKQLRVVLFEDLNLPVIRKTKTGPSTDQYVLERLAGLHPLPQRIIEHRQLAKLKGTYLDALPELIHPETGRIHATFNQVVAATGRLSSSNPNLQNIPIRTDAGRKIRRAFVPGHEGWLLVGADYSQIELRMLAHFSEDPALIRAFEEGADIHRTVAADVFGVPAEDVDTSMRRVAKAVNFGIIYGQSPFGLAAALGIPREEAGAFIDNYFARFSSVAEFMESLLDECARTGYARTILNRRRAIRGIRSFRNRQRTMPERTAINTVIQGSAADLIKRAMIHVHDRLAREQHPGRMLLQIHDELVFECPEPHVRSLVALIRDEMETAMQLRVPLVVDVAAGPNWLDLEPAHFEGA